jgi:hypothetical protein
MKLGEAEPGFDNAPGMLYLAGELYRAATNASLGLGDATGRTKQLLSFEIEPAGGGLMRLAAAIVSTGVCQWLPCPAALLLLHAYFCGAAQKAGLKCDSRGQAHALALYYPAQGTSTRAWC